MKIRMEINLDFDPEIWKNATDGSRGYPEAGNEVSSAIQKFVASHPGLLWADFRSRTEVQR